MTRATKETNTGSEKHGASPRYGNVRQCTLVSAVDGINSDTRAPLHTPPPSFRRPPARPHLSPSFFTPQPVLWPLTSGAIPNVPPDDAVPGTPVAAVKLALQAVGELLLILSMDVDGLRIREREINEAGGSTHTAQRGRGTTCGASMYVSRVLVHVHTAAGMRA